MAVLSAGTYVLRVTADARQSADKAKAAADRANDLAQQAINEILASREIGYQGRAQVCRIQVLLGAQPEGTCLDPQVLQYYDPAEERPTPSFICGLYQNLALAGRPADCEGP